MSNNETRPAFRVYSVIPREGKDDYWLNIGLAFPHSDGKGFNVMLQAFPINPKLVLREASEEEEQRPERQEPQDRRQPAREHRGDRSGGRR